MIAGVLAPDSGEVRLGASLRMGYFAQQSLDVLDPDLTVIEQLQKDFPQDGLGVLRTLAGAFQFSGDDVDKKIRALSGGEKSRLAMARMLYDPPNFLVPAVGVFPLIPAYSQILRILSRLASRTRRAPILRS